MKKRGNYVLRIAALILTMLASFHIDASNASNHLDEDIVRLQQRNVSTQEREKLDRVASSLSDFPH